ncbi:protein-glutamine gamma-glutamyltransferase [Cohnella pontilimi]|uniref:Protein-glutamine gamma-glutamyltransferase n=1 Tax=Cohnella pontilimi TaxID=2564100 RepID=A0A4U0F7P0_9BACL|nr:protein-glutamine gamma-glutamyltransferase [Cohnella pontilimi]TJY40706.1 protein-glutamine gamma-glutamyltransferase [Cohnella pontilimi]
MILIGNSDSVDIGALPLSQTERAVAMKKQRSPVTYRYESTDALLFELRMRSRIVDSAYALLASGIRFTTFEYSEGREPYWFRMVNGGLRLNPDIQPSEAILDIFYNGRAYAVECATAIVIVLYRAVLESIGRGPFNLYFRDLLLYDWHYDEDLRMKSIDNIEEANVGDVLYFKNPDHAPDQPQWQGENTVLLPGGVHYGHGIGIKSTEGIIAGLNRRRRPGSQISAYLTDRVVFPDFAYLRRLSGIVGRIGSSIYIQNL